MNYAIITCAGIGKRMNQPLNKIFLQLANEPIILRTIALFQKSEHIDEIILVAREDDKKELEQQTQQFDKVKTIVLGGDKRQHSVYNGIISLDAKVDDILVIHNGVNPFIDDTTLGKCIEAAKKYEAAIVGYTPRETIKEVDKKGFVIGTHDRRKLVQVQTPQCIRYGTAVKAFKQAFDDDFFGSDDAMLVERLGKKVKVIECPYENIKITLPNDLLFGEKLLKHGRIGFGMDSHRFVKEGDKQLVIGGIPVEGKGFDANSDGDVILHALFNAISLQFRKGRY